MDMQVSSKIRAGRANTDSVGSSVRGMRVKTALRVGRLAERSFESFSTSGLRVRLRARLA
jgi:hypothetical protein